MTKFVVVAGGVISGVGKGVTTASLGKILKEHGFRTTLIKIDPYINYDAGTLRPTEHGEVWVTNDGGETDQDLGTYERFMNEDIPKSNNMTTGQIYKAVIDRERRGEYLGQDVKFIPHITDEIKRRINQAAQGYDIAIIEIGGTVGDYENVPFLFAIKSLEREIGKQNVAYLLVTYLPIPSHIQEMKTKPTQQAVKQLAQEGILPDFIICRSTCSLDKIRRRKIEQYANISSENVISAPDVESIYQIPLDLEYENMGKKVLACLGLKSKRKPNWQKWQELVDAIHHPEKRLKIAIVGKYLDTGDFTLTDSYVSIYQALVHAGAELDVGVDITWIDAKRFEEQKHRLEQLHVFDGVIIPGGFGHQGVEGKLAAISYVREHDIPYLGLCYGMQLAVIEFARNVCDFRGAHTTEVEPDTSYPVVDVLPMQKELLKQKSYGGTMRLGAYPAILKNGSKVASLYPQAVEWEGEEKVIFERHRHRYEVNPTYIEQLEKQGLVFSGYHRREDETKLMEFLELPNRRFFVATQAHPEFKSRLGNPSPVFHGFVQACKEFSEHKSDQKQVQRKEIRLQKELG